MATAAMDNPIMAAIFSLPSGRKILKDEILKDEILNAAILRAVILKAVIRKAVGRIKGVATGVNERAEIDKQRSISRDG